MFRHEVGALILFLLVASEVSAQQHVIVREGETLSQIARRELGDGNRWRYICEINKNIIDDCNVLQVGMTLVISHRLSPEEKVDIAALSGDEKPVELFPERENLINSPTDFASNYWRGYFLKPEMSSGQLDPTGGTMATRLKSADSEASREGAMSGILRKETLDVGEYTVGVWVRSTAGPIAMSFGLSDNYRNGEPILVNDKWQYLQQHFVVTEPTDRIFQIFESTLNNADWEIFGASVEVGIVDTPFYPSVSQ